MSTSSIVSTIITSADSQLWKTTNEFWNESSFDEKRFQALLVETKELRGKMRNFFFFSIDSRFSFRWRFPYVAISIALTIKKRVVLGIVYNPILEDLYTAVLGKGAFKNGQPIRCSGQTGEEKNVANIRRFTTRISPFQNWVCLKSLENMVRVVIPTSSRRNVETCASSSKKFTGFYLIWKLFNKSNVESSFERDTNSVENGDNLATSSNNEEKVSRTFCVLQCFINHRRKLSQRMRTNSGKSIGSKEISSSS